jgi:hypothetical protein
LISVDQLRRRVLLDDDGEDTSLCAFDGYPSNLDCACGHGHNRHTGFVTRCMSYYGQPDCSCDNFVPSAEAVAALWDDARTLLTIVQSTC